MNKLILEGKFIVKDGKKYISTSAVSRDYVLPVVAEGIFKEGSWVTFEGTLRTKNINREDGRRGKVWYGEGSLKACEGTPIYQNSVVADGTIVSIFDIRTTPLTHRKIVDFVVAVDHNYFNCIVFGRTAEALLSSKKVGDKIHLESAFFQSRDYVKDGVDKTAYEVVVRNFI